MEGINSTEIKEFKAPPQIQIDGYLYTKKDALIKGFCYRCSNRNN